MGGVVWLIRAEVMLPLTQTRCHIIREERRRGEGGEEEQMSESRAGGVSLRREVLQLVPSDVVEEALVGAHLLGLDGFEEVPPVVGEGAG